MKKKIIFWVLVIYYLLIYEYNNHWSKSIKTSELKNIQIIDLNNFSYKINSDICNVQLIEIVILVSSAIMNKV